MAEKAAKTQFAPPSLAAILQSCRHNAAYAVDFFVRGVIMATDIRETLALQTATSHVEQYVKQYEFAMHLHYAKMDCYECEAFLQLGIDAFRWLLRADYGLRQGIYGGTIEYDAKAEATLEQLFRTWLVPCEFADRWAKSQCDRGFVVSNLSDFRKCCEEGRAIVELIDDSDTDAMSEQLANLRDQAIYEQQHGETAEFF